MTYRKTNHLTRTSSLSNIQNLLGPSSTTPNHHPVSPSYLTHFDLLDENALPPQDILLIGAPDAPQPGPSTLGLQPPYLSPGDILEDIWVQGENCLYIVSCRIVFIKTVSPRSMCSTQDL